MIVLSYAPAYGIEICDARRFTAEEKTHYAEWFADRGFVGMGNTVELDKITFNDLPDRQPDGEFCGCYNSAWIITEDEAALYKKLNAERQDAADCAQADADAAATAKEQAREQERQECLKQFDSWKVSDVKKQDDDLSVEHTFILNGKEFHFIERNIFDFGTVVNPTTVKGGRSSCTMIKRAGFGIPEIPILRWMLMRPLAFWQLINMENLPGCSECNQRKLC